MTKWVHEINQPLTAIGNYASAAQTLLEQRLRLNIPLSEEETRKIIQWLEQIASQIIRLGKLVDEQDRLSKDFGADKK